MGLRNYLKKLAGHAGRASRSKRGANSHVNTKRNKRASSKAVRTCEYDRVSRQTNTEIEANPQYTKE